MDKITYLNTNTTLDIPVERVLEGAKNSDLDQVFVIGWDKDDILYCASSKGNKAELLYLLKKAELFLMDVYNNGDD